MIQIGGGYGSNEGRKRNEGSRGAPSGVVKLQLHVGDKASAADLEFWGPGSSSKRYCPKFGQIIPRVVEFKLIKVLRKFAHTNRTKALEPHPGSVGGPWRNRRRRLMQPFQNKTETHLNEIMLERYIDFGSICVDVQKNGVDKWPT